MELAQVQTETVVYPESDGRPMAETDAHREQMTDLIFALKQHFRDDPQVYVAGNLFIYYEEHNSKASVAPDVFVVRGVPRGDRRVYKVWEEGRVPEVVIELTSESTRWEDLGTKRALYEWLGVREYFLFDPLAEYLQPLLRGFRLTGGQYVELEDRPLRSEALSLELRVEAERLRLYDAATGEKLLTPAEAAAELERLRAELERLRSPSS